MPRTSLRGISRGRPSASMLFAPTLVGLCWRSWCVSPRSLSGFWAGPRFASARSLAFCSQTAQASHRAADPARPRQQSSPAGLFVGRRGDPAQRGGYRPAPASTSASYTSVIIVVMGSPLDPRPPKSGGCTNPIAFGRKLFIDAQASISVPSTEKCSSESIAAMTWSPGNGDGPRRTYRDRRRHPRVQLMSDHKRQGALGYRLPEGTVPTPDGGMTVV